MRCGRILLLIAGLLFSTVPPLWATLAYFPIWGNRGGGAVLSGLSLLLLLFCFTPLFNLVKSHLKTPSAPIMWLIVFITFFALAEIADEMKVIAFWGFAGNAVGSILFHLSRKVGGCSSNEGI
jgi:hypothetical protein